jgi:hypothetical protein
VKKDQPIVVFFSAIGSPDPLPSLNINFWGTRDQSFNACYPAAALNMGLA